MLVLEMSWENLDRLSRLTPIRPLMSALKISSVVVCLLLLPPLPIFLPLSHSLPLPLSLVPRLSCSRPYLVGRTYDSAY